MSSNSLLSSPKISLNLFQSEFYKTYLRGIEFDTIAYASPSLKSEPYTEYNAVERDIDIKTRERKLLYNIKRWETETMHGDQEVADSRIFDWPPNTKPPSRHGFEVWLEHANVPQEYALSYSHV